MIIPIKPWLELSDAASSVSGVKVSGAEGNGFDWNGLALSSSIDMENNAGDEPDRGVISAADLMGGGRGGELPFYHESVLPGEVLDALKPGEGKQIFDGTLGGGGHSEMLLRAGAHVIGCDQDAEALAHASKRLESFGDQFLPVQANFGDMDVVFEELGIDTVDGILLDIGVSSRQIDSADRGFSFMREGPLDMRMNREAGKSAADLVNEADEFELGRIFRDYGEEKSWRKVAAAIVKSRKDSPITTTLQLSELVGTVIPKRSAKNPATKVFQALRIAVNDELGRLEVALEKATNFLGRDGVLAVITFHSLEDRIVKQFFRRTSMPYIDRPEWPEPKENPDYRYNLLQRRAVSPTDEELSRNPRARSAKLRAGVRV